jgi:hypothetical protein
MQFLRAKRLRARCVTDNVRIIRRLIQSHQAVGVLPEHSCVDLMTDRRLRATLLPKRRDVWLLVQSHLKRAACAAIAWTCASTTSHCRVGLRTPSAASNKRRPSARSIRASLRPTVVSSMRSRALAPA